MDPVLVFCSCCSHTQTLLFGSCAGKVFGRKRDYVIAEAEYQEGEGEEEEKEEEEGTESIKTTF